MGSSHQEDDHVFLSEDETGEKLLKSGCSSRKRPRGAAVLDSSDKKKDMKTKVCISEKPVWESSIKDDDARPFFVQKHDWLANDTVKAHVSYYPSFEAVITELRRLELTETHMEAIQHTPFWALVASILVEGDDDALMNSTKKHEDDIRLLLRKFDYSSEGFWIGERLIKLEKQDLVSIFGVRDGTDEIIVQKGFQSTQWMRRCFGNLMNRKSTKVTHKLGKRDIYKKLLTVCGEDDKIHAQDVARLMHCYLLASFFMSNIEKSIPLGLCVFLENFSDICKFDWSNLIVNQLVKQMAQTTSFRFDGCAMLLPYWLCEHTGFIHSNGDHLFPFYLRWDLNRLHQKIREAGLDVVREKLIIKTHLESMFWEEGAFRELIEETQDASYGVDTVTRTRNAGGNVKQTEAKVAAATKTAIPGIIESVPETNQTVLLQTGLSETDDVVNNTPLNEKLENPHGANWFDGPLGSVEPGNDFSSRSKKLVDVEGDDVLPSTERVESMKDLKAKIHEKQKLLIEVQHENNILRRSLTTQKDINTKQEQDSRSKKLVKVEGDDVLPSTERVKSTKYSGFDGPSCSLERGSHLSPRYKGTVGLARDEVLPSSEKVEYTKCCSTHEQLILANAFWKDKHKDLEKSMKQLSQENDILKTTAQQNMHLKAELEELSNQNDTLLETTTQKIRNLTAKLEKLSNEKEILIKTTSQQIGDLNLELDEVRSKLDGKEKLLSEVQSKRDDLASLLTAQKEINVNQSHDIGQLLKRETEIKLLNKRGNQRVDELESEISTLKEHLKSAQTKEHALEKKCDDLSASELLMKDKFDAQKASLNKKITMLESKVAELTPAHEDPKARVEELGARLIRTKESIICNLQREGNTRADNADKKKLGVAPSDAQYGKGKSKVTPDVYSPGSVARSVERTRDDAVKVKPVTVTPDYRKVICLSDEEVLPMKKENKRSANEIYNRQDQVFEFLRNINPGSPNGSVIWSGKGTFSKVTADDAKVLLENKRLTGRIIDSWGELLIQHLKKKGTMTSTFIFTSRILEVIEYRHGESSTIQAIVDSQIRRAVDSQILILPVLDYANSCWTLLKYDVSCSTWTFFHTMWPQSGVISRSRPFLYQLVEYMEKRISDLIDLKNILLARPNKNGTNVPLQQIMRPQFSLDSGVIICNIMETILKGHAISTINTTSECMYRKSTAHDYRFRMVKSFCFPDQME